MNQQSEKEKNATRLCKTKISTELKLQNWRCKILGGAPIKRVILKLNIFKNFVFPLSHLHNVLRIKNDDLHTMFIFTSVNHLLSFLNRPNIDSTICKGSLKLVILPQYLCTNLKTSPTQKVRTENVIEWARCEIN